MIPRKFEYYRAKSVEDAIEFLSTHEGAKVIASVTLVRQEKHTDGPVDADGQDV